MYHFHGFIKTEIIAMKAVYWSSLLRRCRAKGKLKEDPSGGSATEQKLDSLVQ